MLRTDPFELVFKALSDLTRVRALKAILSAGEPVCVCELADALQIPQYQVSKHLSILRQAGLVADTRIGTWVYYSVSPSAPEFVLKLYELIRNEVKGPVFDADEVRLNARLAMREDGRCVVGPGRGLK